jgi:hypothetical protein
MFSLRPSSGRGEDNVWDNKILPSDADLNLSCLSIWCFVVNRSASSLGSFQMWHSHSPNWTCSDIWRQIHILILCMMYTEHLISQTVLCLVRFMNWHESPVTIWNMSIVWLLVPLSPDTCFSQRRTWWTHRRRPLYSRMNNRVGSRKLQCWYLGWRNQVSEREQNFRVY